MHIFAIIPAFAVMVSSAAASSTWSLSFYSSKACLAVHNLDAFADNVKMSCENLDSSIKIHGVQGSGLGNNWHAMIYSGEDCTGSEHTLTGSACNDCQNLFGAGTTKTIKSFKVVKA